MASPIWTGGSQSIAQVNTVTPGGTIAATDTFNIVINGKTKTFTSAGATVALVVTGLDSVYDGCTEPEFLEQTATDDVSKLTITGNVAGVPFVQTSSADDVSGGVDPTLVTATDVNASGPNFASVGANWSTGSAPANSDSVYFEGDVSLKYGLDLSAVTVTLARVNAFLGQIGNAPRNPNLYAEYRPQYFQLAATTLELTDKNQSGMIRWDTGTVQTAVIVSATGSPADPTIPAFTWIGTHASNTFTHVGGDAGICVRPGEVATVATLRVGGGVANQNPTLEIGSGATLTTVKQASGEIRTRSGCTTLTIEGGLFMPIGSCAFTTVHVRTGGRIDHQSSGTITTLNVGSRGECVFDHRARTVTNCNLYAGAVLKDPHKNVTFTNGIILQQCSLADVILDVGPGVTITVA